jgi:hypothetical protein
LHHWEKTVSLRKNLLKKIIEIFVEYKLQEFIPQIYYDLKSSIVPLRFVFVCTKKTKNLFYKHLGKFVNLEQIWFREPIVTCPEGPESLGYDKGLCEISEKTGEFILNLPVNIPEKYISAFEKNLHLRLKRIARKLCNI